MLDFVDQTQHRVKKAKRTEVEKFLLREKE